MDGASMHGVQPAIPPTSQRFEYEQRRHTAISVRC